MIKPSIGRKVWFWPGSNRDRMMVYDQQQALDATVIHVYGDRVVNLQVIDHGGFTHTVHSAVLHQPEDPIPCHDQPHATWMPFQVGQAKGEQSVPLGARQ